MPKLITRRIASPTNGGAAKYPQYLAAVKRLVEQHRKIKDEPLHLAVYFAPKRNPRDVFLFEVIGGFGGEHIDPEKKIFEISFGSTAGFELPPSRHLRLVLTNPVEFAKAVQGKWKGVMELKEAKHRGTAQIVFRDAMGREFWELL
jgi:hypothetical protein